MTAAFIVNLNFQFSISYNNINCLFFCVQLKDNSPITFFFTNLLIPNKLLILKTTFKIDSVSYEFKEAHTRGIVSKPVQCTFLQIIFFYYQRSFQSTTPSIKTVLTTSTQPNHKLHLNSLKYERLYNDFGVSFYNIDKDSHLNVKYTSLFFMYCHNTNQDIKKKSTSLVNYYQKCF